MQRHIAMPTFLTISRLCLLPVAALAVLLRWGDGMAVAAAATAVAGVTDALDGYLARRSGKTTAAGAQLDLAADKLFVTTMLLVLAAKGAIPWWVMGTVVAREAAVSAIRLVHFRGRVAPGSDIWGKMKMAASIVAIAGVLLQQDLEQGGLLASVPGQAQLSALLGLAPWTMLLAVALTLASGLNYLVSYLGLLPGGRTLLPHGGAWQAGSECVRKAAYSRRTAADRGIAGSR
ncbi:MAG: CDP-alcohol phosphatidyltransferase family protein [Chloroflexi bacterium]|nr:CDP-alcohol phosphatidyltransferase family protein [Chloroflexota bacterium]